MLTRLEVFRVSRGIKMSDLVEESGYHRSHVLRIRQGTIEPGRDAIAAIVSAMRRLSLEDVHAETLFELTVEESGPWRPDRARRLTREITAYRRERSRTQTILANLSKRGREEWFTALRRIPNGISVAVARAAALEGRRLIDSSPKDAEALFDLSARIADVADDAASPGYRAFLSGRARLERGNALRQLGAYASALPLLEEAELRFAGIPTCTHELGRTWFARGSILFKMNGLDEALHWLRLAVNIFAATDDQRRIARVRLVEGNILFERGDWDGAHALWLGILPAFEAGRDRHSLASTWLNLGWCDVERGQPRDAGEWFARALDRFSKLRSRADVARTRWGLAVCEARFGDRRIGLSQLRRESEELERLGLLTEAGGADLDAAEILLLDQGNDRPVAMICNRLLPLFQHAGAAKEVMKALAYLAETANAHLATAEFVRRVRTELKRAQRDEAYRFNPEMLM